MTEEKSSQTQTQTPPSEQNNATKTQTPNIMFSNINANNNVQKPSQPKLILNLDII